MPCPCSCRTRSKTRRSTRRVTTRRSLATSAQAPCSRACQMPHGMSWDQKSLIDSFRPWIARGELHYLQNVPSSELRTLYKHALMTVCPSLAEGFDYSGAEAMRCGCAVASSDIPVHREVYGEGSA